jgi:hypothetical protein
MSREQDKSIAMGRTATVHKVRAWKTKAVPSDLWSAGPEVRGSTDYLDYTAGSSKQPASPVPGFNPQPVDHIPCGVDRGVGPPLSREWMRSGLRED